MVIKQDGLKQKSWKLLANDKLGPTGPFIDRISRTLQYLAAIGIAKCDY